MRRELYAVLRALCNYDPRSLELADKRRDEHEKTDNDDARENVSREDYPDISDAEWLLCPYGGRSGAHLRL